MFEAHTEIYASNIKGSGDGFIAELEPITTSFKRHHNVVIRCSGIYLRRINDESSTIHLQLNREELPCILFSGSKDYMLVNYAAIKEAKEWLAKINSETGSCWSEEYLDFIRASLVQEQLAKCHMRDKFLRHTG